MKKFDIIKYLLIIIIIVCVVFLVKKKINNEDQSEKSIIVDSQIEVIYKEGTNELNLDEKNNINFTLKNLTNNSLDYTITINYGNNIDNKERYNDSAITIDLIEIIGSNEQLLLDNADYESINNLKLYNDVLLNIPRTYKLIISLKNDNEKNYNKYATFNVNIELKKDENNNENNDNNDDDGNNSTHNISNLSQKVLDDAKINSLGTCGNVIYEEDGIKYLSGTNSCIYYNYVWYSGKMWRITSIYPDGSMKLITHNSVTSISFNQANNNKFMNSYVYEWLNNDFLNTLYNYQNIIDSSKKWDASQSTPFASFWNNNKPSGNEMVSATVGLINSYEYYLSYKKMQENPNIQSSICDNNNHCGLNPSYLFNGESYWFLESGQNENGRIGHIIVDEMGISSIAQVTGSSGVRPAIYVKGDLKFGGNGTINNPYIFNDDKKIGVIGDLINTRTSGEYIQFKNDDELYRIVGVENGTTKVVAVKPHFYDKGLKFATGNLIYGANGYAIEGDENAHFNIYGEERAQGTGTYYDYANNIWYPTLVQKTGDLFVDGKYSIGTVNEGSSYKNSVGGKTITTKVGMPRYGEMFSVNNYSESVLSNPTLLLTREGGSSLWCTKYSAVSSSITKELVKDAGIGMKPTLHLKSDIKILGGSGILYSPYIVGI